MLVYRQKISGVLYALLLATFCTLGLAQGDASATDTPNEVAGDTVFYFYDKLRQFDHASVQEQAIEAGRFAPLSQANVPMGTGFHWLYFDVPQSSQPVGDSLLLELDFPNIDQVEALVVYASGETKRYTTGDEVAFNQWPIAYRKPTIPLTEITGSAARVILCVKIETPLILPINLVEKSRQQAQQQGEYFLYGLFYGAIFILAIYNAAVYFSLRDKSYRYYVIYVLSFALVQASTTGIGQQFLWPNLDHATTRIALLAIIATHFFMVHFAIYFLDIAQHRPLFVKPMRWTAYIALLLAPLLALPEYAYTQFAIHIANVLGMVVILSATVSVLGSNRRTALFLLISYLVLFSAITLALLFQANLIAHYPFIDYSMSTAILIEAVILSVGLSDRIRQLRDSSEAAERENRIVQEKLSQQLITAREQERAEISRLLHDSVNHNLVVIRNRVGQLSSHAATLGTDASADVAAIDQLLNSTIDQVRNISHLKHPQMVRHLGLQPALEALVESAFDDSVMVNMYIEDIPLSYDVQLFLYRAVQECTTNIIKHAQASECIIRLFRDPDTSLARFIIRDDGSGFDAEGRNWRFGLRTLNEHCKSLGGTLNITSNAQEGTTLSVTFPTNEERTRE